MVYFTALFPYVVLTIFFVRGLTLKGAGAGLAHMFYPKMESLLQPTVWLNAAVQVWSSLLEWNVNAVYSLDASFQIEIGDKPKQRAMHATDRVMLCLPKFIFAQLCQLNFCRCQYIFS